jgi:hypothetical protein
MLTPSRQAAPARADAENQLVKVVLDTTLPAIARANAVSLLPRCMRAPSRGR